MEKSTLFILRSKKLVFKKYLSVIKMHVNRAEFLTKEETNYFNSTLVDITNTNNKSKYIIKNLI